MRLNHACLALLFSCVTLLTAAPAADGEAIEKLFQAANAKLDAGEFQPAIETYNEILEAEPKAGNVWVMRAIAKWSLQDRSGARADLAQALSLHPDNPDALRVRGQFRYREADYEGSLADFTRAIDLLKPAIGEIAARDAELSRIYNHGLAELHGMRAEVEMKRKVYRNAIDDLTRAVELYPDYLAAFYLRAQVHALEGRADAADADYSKVLALDPDNANALNNRAWLRFHHQRWKETVADGQRVLELEPAAADAQRVVGFAQFAQGDYAAAANTLGASADADPTTNSAYALFVRHHALLRRGEPDKRLATAWGAWQDEPWVQALAKFITGQLDEEALEAVAKDTADDAERAARACEMHFYIGLARLQAGDRSTARLRFEAALRTEQKTFIEDALSHAELARLR